MPTMPRPDEMPKKVAFSILGVPCNMKKKKGKKSKLEKRLASEETQRPRSVSERY